MNYGWFGKLLYIDLSKKEYEIRDIPSQILKKYLGGRGLGVRLMRDFYQLNPFDPDIPIFFAVGPLSGTSSPTSARMSVVSRSPLTETIFDCSAGGRFAWQIKSAGFDVLQIVGTSEEPVVVRINNDKCTFLSAKDLWGKDVPETNSILKGDGSVASIGIAGENKVLYANIMTSDGNSVGRGGLGAVMGGKNLKALVVDGNRKIDIADRELFDKAKSDIMRLFNASPIIFGPLGLAQFGTPALVDIMAQRRMAPTENFRKSFFAESNFYSAPKVADECGAKKNGCYGCPIQCKKSDSTGNHLPEYETLSHFGALNAISDLKKIVEANNLCNTLGLDTISAAATISAYSEIIGNFPQPSEISSLLKSIAAKDGIGELLSLGSSRMARKMGREELSMSVKSLELPGYDPRGSYGMALAYCTSNRGGCHLRAYPVSSEILRKPVPTDRFSLSGKARIISIAEDSNAAVDSMIACKFAFFGASIEEYSELLSAVTGENYNSQILKKIGENIVKTERYYNSQNGFSRKDDYLPERFYTEEGSSGDGIEIKPIDKKRFDEELDKYYSIRGIDKDGKKINMEVSDV